MTDIPTRFQVWLRPQLGLPVLKTAVRVGKSVTDELTAVHLPGEETNCFAFQALCGG